jgi:hypothetical protein
MDGAPQQNKNNNTTVQNKTAKLYSKFYCGNSGLNRGLVSGTNKLNNPTFLNVISGLLSRPEK